MNTNNGLERKNRDFKDGFLKQLKAKSFSGMLTALIDQFLSEKHDRYNPKPFFSTLWIRWKHTLVIYLDFRSQEVT